MDFDKKFHELLWRCGYTCEPSSREREDRSAQIAAQAAKLDYDQKEEALRIVDGFFEEADNMKLYDASYPVVTFETRLMVPHCTKSKLTYVMHHAETLIAQRFDELGLGGEFNANVEYLGTYARGRVVHSNFMGEDAMDHCRITIEMELENY